MNVRFTKIFYISKEMKLNNSDNYFFSFWAYVFKKHGVAISYKCMNAVYCNLEYNLFSYNH